MMEKKKHMQYHIRICKIVLIVMCVVINLLSPSILGDSNIAKKIIYVDDDADPDWYDETHVKTISEGINNATDGDTVYVYNGTYYENITLTKSLSLIGEQQQTTIIDGCQQGNVIAIETNNVTVSGFTLRNTSINDIWEHWAIKIQKNVDGPSSYLRDITISQCIITDNKGGILLRNVTDCRIHNCSIYNNSYSSLTVRYRSGNIFIDNSTFYHNGEKINDNTIHPGGVIIDGYNKLCTNLTMTNCKIYENIGIGLKLVGVVHNMSVERSIINDNSWWGIYLGERGENITIHHCKVFGNRRGGIYILDRAVKRGLLLSIHNILIHNDTIMNNGDGNLFTTDGGIIIYNCINCVRIIDNNITSNNGYGVYFSRSRNNKVINNNFINNMCHASFSDYALWNKWRGNYWDNWIGFGPKRIIGKFKSLILPWYNFDWHPARDPQNTGAYQ